MHTVDETRPNTPPAKLNQAIDLAKAGHKDEAATLLRQVVAAQPVNQAAWLWLSAVTTEPAEASAALEQAKAIDPSHPSLNRAKDWLDHRFAEQAAVLTENEFSLPPSGSTPASSPKKIIRVFNLVTFALVVTAIVIGLIVLLLGLIWEVNATALADNLMTTTSGSTTSTSQPIELETALAEQNWPRAIEVLEGLRQTDPDSAVVAPYLAYAHTQLGINLRSRGFVEEATPHFERALAMAPEQVRTQQEQQLASAYLSAVRHYERGDWPAAIAEFEMIWAESKSYPNVRDLLFSAYYNHGLALKAAGAVSRAKDALEAATVLYPDMSEPRRILAEIEFDLAPQTPLKTPLGRPPISDRLVLVSVAEQQMRVYEADELVFEFVVSTGEPGRDTAIGEFEILNKIDVAYASTWNLDMPYWMGIYWSGPLQNGIHSLPIVKHTGDKLWDGYLGQRVSYGCVILSDADSATLYDWAEIGTKVKIVPSFAYWSPEAESES